jgi:nucleoside-diphosphate kinase
VERTFVMVKPDGMRRKLAGEVIRRLERKGLNLEMARVLQLSPQLAQEHYAEHREKPFFANLITYICSGPVLAMVWSGKDAIALTRMLVGHRDPRQALPGTIRGDYVNTTTENLVHASDGPQAAQREIQLFFGGEAQ